MSQEQNSRVKEILDTTGLNWVVRPETIQTSSGIPVEGYQALVRSDNNTPLSVCSESYFPFQNHELIELLDKVSKQTGLELKKGGYFGEGEKVYVQLKSDNLILNGDKIEGYLTGINSFDGSTSLAFGPSSVTISCMNSFFSSFRQIESKVRHTKNMVVRIDEICKRLDGVLEEEKVIFDNIVKLSEVKIDDKVRDLVTKSLFNIDRQVDLKDFDSISTVTRNKLSRFHIDLNGELQQKGDNLWGLFSGVTKYTTHSLSKNDNTEAKMFGIYGKREIGIFQELVEMV